MLDGLLKRLKFPYNPPSNSVQHDKKILFINVEPVKIGLYLRFEERIIQNDREYTYIYREKEHNFDSLSQVENTSVKYPRGIHFRERIFF